MLPLFLYPLALFGLVAVPALVAIYLFRNRFRRHVVSSLMLWLDTRESREGGRRLRYLQTPLLFLLELLIIILLVLAAGEPHLRLHTSSRPLVVVLDDSFSMLAGGEESPRAQAVKALREQLDKQTPYSIRFVLAGSRPQLLGEQVRSTRRAMTIIDNWKCKSPAARLDEALALAAELGGELSQLLVLTDHAPAADLPNKGRVQWWAFGKPRGNVAFVNAARTEREGLDRCLLEIANFDQEARKVRLVIRPLDGGAEIRRNLLDMAADETQRLILQFPAGTPGVVAQLDDGELPMDSEVILLPAQARTVRVDIRLRDRRLREPVEKAITAARMAKMTSVAPDLIFSDRGEEPEQGNSWVVHLLSEKESTSYAGPFVLDRAHPLTDGLSLRSVIWGAGKEMKVDGAPILMAGNVPLITDSESPTPGGSSRHDLRIRVVPDLSTVQDSPDWPILFWNILNWRASALPGLNRLNIRMGESVVLNLSDYRETVDITTPGEKQSQKVAIKGRQGSFKGEEVGLYEIHSDEAKFRFAVNALHSDESDLRQAFTGKWGDWLDDTTLRLEYRGISWILLLCLLAVALLHLMLMARSRTAPSSSTGG